MSEAKFIVDCVAEAIARVAVKQKIPDFHTQAVAAIEAMREPTEDMLLQGTFGDVSSGDAKYVWASMIDAALGKVDA